MVVVKKTVAPLRRTTLAPAKRTAAVESADLEEDCGFKFRRVSKPAAVVAAAAAVVENSNNNNGSNSTGKSSNNNLNNLNSLNNLNNLSSSDKEAQRRRRRSSFAAIASRTASRPSSISVTLSQKLPAASVESGDYHKHLMPDLPGPIKMRQLLLWAMQRTAARQRDPAVAEMAEEAVQALFSNRINTSWYQRPAESGSGKGSAYVGPKNQALVDCIQLYERYAARLQGEKAEWERISQQAGLLEALAAIREGGGAADAAAAPASNDDDAADQKQLHGLATWFASLPTTVDRLDWTLSMAGNFEAHARSYCESVFHQIRARLFGGDSRAAPMVLLRALSTVSAGSS